MTTTTGSVVCVCRPAFCDYDDYDRDCRLCLPACILWLWRLRPGLSSVFAGRRSVTMTTTTGTVVCVWRRAFCDYDDYDRDCHLCLPAGVLWLWRLRPGLSSVFAGVLCAFCDYDDYDRDCRLCLPACVLWLWRLRPGLSSVFAGRRSVIMTTTTGTVVCVWRRAFCDYDDYDRDCRLCLPACILWLTTTTGTVVFVCRRAFSDYDDYDWDCRLCLPAGVLWLRRLQLGLVTAVRRRQVFAKQALCLPACILWLTTTTGTVVCVCRQVFCNYDDYNWDWSLQYVGVKCLPNKLKAIIVKSPRVYHIGEWYSLLLYILRLLLYLHVGSSSCHAVQ